MDVEPDELLVCPIEDVLYISAKPFIARKGTLAVTNSSYGTVIHWSEDYSANCGIFTEIEEVKIIVLRGKVMTLLVNYKFIQVFKFMGEGYRQVLNLFQMDPVEGDSRKFSSRQYYHLREAKLRTYSAHVSGTMHEAFPTWLRSLSSLFDWSHFSVFRVEPLSSRSTGDQTPSGPSPPDQQPVSVRNVSSPTTVSVEECYRMTSKPRGLALILDNEDFSQSPGCSNRTGTRVDAENLNTLFSGLGFKVTTQRNLTAEEMRGEIKEFAGKADDHAKADMCVVVILSHGSNGVIYGTDGIPVKIKWILQQFNNASCPQLQGKPKFFVFQCCRGDEEDYGTAKFIVSSTETDARGQNPQPKELTFEDMLIAYSTIPEYVSHRDTTKGTWYIQCLVKVFKERAGDTDIRRMLDLVAYRLKNCESEDGQKQSCSYEVIHLYHKLIFGPEHAQ